MDNVNKNVFDVDMLPEYEGKRVLKVLNIVIPDEGSASYLCIMDDGSKMAVPAEIFNT